jgi:hypothetical protein
MELVNGTIIAGVVYYWEDAVRREFENWLMVVAGGRG